MNNCAFLLINSLSTILGARPYFTLYINIAISCSQKQFGSFFNSYKRSFIVKAMTDYILQVISNWYLQPKCVKNVFLWIRFNNNIQWTITGPDQFKDYTPFLQIINTSSHYLSSKSRMLIQNLCCYSTPLTKTVGSVSCKR